MKASSADIDLMHFLTCINDKLDIKETIRHISNDRRYEYFLSVDCVDLYKLHMREYS